MFFLWPNGGNKANWDNIHAIYYYFSQVVYTTYYVIQNYGHSEFLSFRIIKISNIFHSELLVYPPIPKGRDKFALYQCYYFHFDFILFLGTLGRAC